MQMQRTLVYVTHNGIQDPKTRIKRFKISFCT